MEKEDRGLSSWLPKAESRWGQDDTKGNQTIPCLPAGPKLKLAQHSEMFYAAPLCPSSATHLVNTHLMIFNICELPEGYPTPRGKQKDLSVEGGKPGSGWGPPVPRGPTQLSTTWRGRCHTQFPFLCSQGTGGSLGWNHHRNLAVADPNVCARDSQESETPS